MNEPEHTSAPDTAAAPPARRRRSFWPWSRFALPPLLLLVGIAGLLGWLTATPAGFATLWQWAGKLSHDSLKVGRSEGTLWRGFTLRDVSWQRDGQQLQLSSLQLDWQPSALWRGQLYIRQLALGNIHYAGKASSKAPAPPQAPRSLALPLDVRLDALTVGSISQPGQPLLSALRANYRYEGGRHYFTLQQLDTPWGGATVGFTLLDTLPFRLAGELHYRGVLEGVASQGNVNLAGSLLQPRLDGEISAQGMLIKLNSEWRPFAAAPLQRLRRLDARVGGVNPHALLPTLPQARLALAIGMEPLDADSVRGGISLVNSEPGPVSAQRLPLSLLWGDFRIDGDRLTLPGLQAELAGGSITLSGSAASNALALDAELRNIDSHQLHAALPSHRINGEVQAAGKARLPQLVVKLSNQQLGLDARLRLADAPRRLEVPEMTLRTGLGRLQGEMGWLFDSRQLSFSGRLQGFDPSRVDPRWPAGNINGTLDTHASLATTPHGDVALKLAGSQLSGAALGGQLALQWQPQRVKQLQADLSLGRNRLQASGGWGQSGDKLLFNLTAPQLSLLGPAFGGELDANVQLAGTPARPDIAAKLAARALRLPGGVAVGSLQGEGSTGLQQDSPFRLQLAGREVRAGGQQLDTLQLNASGNRAAHQLQLEAHGLLQDKPQSVNLALNGGLLPQGLRWQGQLAALRAAGGVNLRLEAPVALQLAADEVRLGASRWQALGTQWQLDDTGWQQGKGWRSSGRVNSLALAALSPWLKLPVQQDLVLAGDWSLAGQQGWPQGRLSLRRERGDVQLPQQKGGPQSLGLSRAELQLGLGPAAPLRLLLESRYGRISGDGTLQLPPGAGLDAAQVAARVQLALPSLAPFQPWLGSGFDLDGALDADVRLSGPLTAPLYAGEINGHKLRFIERKNGIRLEQGELLARLQQRTLQVEKLSFGQQGGLQASGQLSLDGDQPGAAINLRLTRFVLIERPGRRLTVSGDSRVTLEQGKVFLRGDLGVDQARMELPRLGGPKLSSDVVVVGRTVEADSDTRLPLGVDLNIRLGNDFHFSGNGLNAELGGNVRLLAAPGAELQARGQVRVDKGRFKAYGQDLDISKGVITFNGPLDNPSLDIVATRRNSSVGAGVEIGGSVLLPSVKLVANEAMSEQDKLSYMVLGRAATPGEGSNDMGGASAGGFLAGMLNDRIGLFDDVGVQSRAASTSSSGTVNPAEQVVTLGKQITRELYVGYEYGLKSAEQAVKFSYQLSQKLSVIARAGREASSELRYTFRFD
ncbi:translocation/assembly module TamB domain-containing protein [Vogesella sp. LIG4]|uniref:translocation/assembly module TamB domain-containing protein n=1 Tax=Vogesella sp. LIG4 TaxID=1192162 RepID=UPI0012FD7E0B|nr:translocation/assembly module TamB domain-containing protein [Vogesella sp. LIG4]